MLCYENFLSERKYFNWTQKVKFPAISCHLRKSEARIFILQKGSSHPFQLNFQLLLSFGK